jgi:hypothetical protein
MKPYPALGTSLCWSDDYWDAIPKKLYGCQRADVVPPRMFSDGDDYSVGFFIGRRIVALCLAKTKSACEINNIQRRRVICYMDENRLRAEFWRRTTL